MSRTVSAEDFAAVALVSDPQFSPLGDRIACVRRRIDLEKGKSFAEIWVVPAGDGEPQRFTGGDTSASSPRWSPDGRTIAFLSDRQKPISQIFGIAAGGGEAAPITKIPTEGSIHGIRWSPDGSQIAFLYRLTPENYTKEAGEERKKSEKPSPPRVHKRLNYRMDAFGYYDGSFTQVWVANVETGASTQITSGDFNCDLPVWSPDGSMLAFLSDRREDSDILPAHTDIWTVSPAGGELTLVASPPCGKHAIAWSPDGASFAYVSSGDADDAWGTRNDGVMLIPVAGADRATELMRSSDLTVGYLCLSDVHDAGAGDLLAWNSDSSALFFPVSSFGDTRLAMVMASGGDILPLSPANSEMGGFSITSDGRAAVTLGSPVTPHELYLLRSSNEGGGKAIGAEQLTHFNAEWLAEVSLSTPEPFSAPNGDGGEVSGWIIRPPDCSQTQPCPLVLYVHGGPHAQYGNILFQELQYLAAQGFAVLYTNPRGSKGYGEEHTRAIRGNWGGPDFRDIMAAADYGAEQPFVDPARMAIMGGSYGGYMTAWAVGHTDRFRCAIADRLVASLTSMAGTCDFSWRPGSYFGGDSWSDPAELRRCSPLTYAADIHTPLLLIHSDGDLRCPIGQAEELFAALRIQRKIVEFVRYPAETSHGMSRNGPPALRLDRLNRNVDWLNRWLRA